MPVGSMGMPSTNRLRFRSSMWRLAVQSNVPRRTRDEIADDAAYDSSDDRARQQHPNEPRMERREQHSHGDGLGVLEREDDEADDDDDDDGELAEPSAAGTL